MGFLSAETGFQPNFRWTAWGEPHNGIPISIDEGG
jgi:hypothetical protein